MPARRPAPAGLILFVLALLPATLTGIWGLYGPVAAPTGRPALVVLADPCARSFTDGTDPPVVLEWRDDQLPWPTGADGRG